MDSIRITDLEVFFRIGVPDHERAQPQRLLITIDIERDLRFAGAADDLTKTIDYYAVVQRILKLGENREWKLLEALAEEIATIILKEFGAFSAIVEVKKFIIPQTQSVSVKIYRPL
jgi:7,8-dihydroneopterin aldolase/epimerase/oxygenase